MHEEERDGDKMRSVKREKEGEAKEEKVDTVTIYPHSQAPPSFTSLPVIFHSHAGRAWERG